MNQQLYTTSALGLSFLLLFGLAELLYHYAHVRAEVTRKTVHTGTGILTLLFPLLLNSHWQVLVLCGSFALILLLSLKLNLLKSINAIGRKSYGSMTYPLAVYGCFLVYTWQRETTGDTARILFYLPILILAICDPLAALCGRRWPYGQYRNGRETKTLLGSGMFFLSAFLISLGLLFLCGNSAAALLPRTIAALLIALATALTEALCTKGADNLFIPFAALLAYHFTSFLPV